MAIEIISRNVNILPIFIESLDGYAYYEEWQKLVEDSDKRVKELLETVGAKCKQLGVCKNICWNFFRQN